MMIPYKFKNFKEIKAFGQLASKCSGYVFLHSQNSKQIVNAKSVMGMYTLDLSQPIMIEVQSPEDALILAEYCKPATQKGDNI